MPPTLPTPPATVADFKTRFARDFKFGDGDDRVKDADIARAMSDAMTVFNPRLFSVADGWVGFLNVAAHYVVVNIQAVGGLSADNDGLGVENQAQGLIASKSVNGISIGLVDPPEWVKKIPLLYQLWITDYGRKYVSMVQPKLVGNVHAVSGPREAGAAGSPSVPFTDY